MAGNMIHIDTTFPRRRETVSSRFIEILIVFIMPPVAVLLNRGPGKEFFISVVLTFLGYFPGVVYTFYIIYSEMTDDHLKESEGPQ